MINHKYYSIAHDVSEAKQYGFADTVSHKNIMALYMGMLIGITCCIVSVIVNVATPTSDVTSIALKTFQILFLFAITWIVFSKKSLTKDRFIVGFGSAGICCRLLGYDSELIAIEWRNISNISALYYDGGDSLLIKTKLDLNSCMLGGIVNGHFKAANNLYEIEFSLGTNVSDFSNITFNALLRKNNS